MSLGFITFEEFARDETSHDRAIAGALPGTMNQKLFAVPIGFGSNFVGEFQFEDCVLQCLSVDKNNLAVDAEASAYQASKWHQDAIITRFGIMIKVDKGGSGHLRVV